MKDEKILAAARARLQEAQDAEKEHIDRGVSDMEFAAGVGQWLEADRMAREAEGKPTLTFNAAPQFVRRITGQIRQMNPAVKVSASDSAASPDVAEIYEGLFREIEQRCDAPSIYESAAESAAQCGIGHWRIRTEYVDETSFDQQIVIERVFNPFSVFYDPLAKDPTRKDARYAFVLQDMPREEFKTAYPDAALEDISSEHHPSWLQRFQTPDTITVAEYYWTESKDEEIHLFEDGSVWSGKLPPGVNPVRSRKAKRPVVRWMKTNGSEILEGPTDVPGRYIPVVPVVGEELHIGDQVYRASVIRHAKDAMVTYNMMRTLAVETAMLQPRAPYLVTPAQVSGLEEFWRDANTSNSPYLPYNPDQDAPPPSRQPPPVVSAAFAAEAQIAAEDMKRTTGIYDAALGARSNETSGVAINARQREADIANSVYTDNMVKSVRHSAEIIMTMIPQVYDTNRIIRILGEDAQEKLVAINAIAVQDGNPIPQNDLTIGRYSVRVSVGPSYSSRKAEASAGMLDFLRSIPQAGMMIGDLVAKAQEWPQADRIAERLKRGLPPGVLDEDEQGDMTPEKAAQMQAQAQQAQQQAAMQAQAQHAEIQKAIAEAREAAADAAKAEAEAQKAQIELQATMAHMRAGLMMPAMGAIAPPPGQGPL